MTNLPSASNVRLYTCLQKLGASNASARRPTQAETEPSKMNPRDLLAYHKARRIDETQRDETRLRNESKQMLRYLKEVWKVRTICLDSHPRLRQCLTLSFFRL